MAINVKPLGDRVDPHADRYGDPEGVNLTTLMPGSYDHVVAAPHCDRYGVTSKEMIQGKKSPTRPSW
jgi:hypothetical protein